MRSLRDLLFSKLNTPRHSSCALDTTYFIWFMHTWQPFFTGLFIPGTPASWFGRSFSIWIRQILGHLILCKLGTFWQDFANLISTVLQTDHLLFDASARLKSKTFIQINILSSITIKPTQIQSYTCTILGKLLPLNTCSIVQNHKLEVIWKLRNTHKEVWVHLQASTVIPRQDLTYPRGQDFSLSLHMGKRYRLILPAID